jgi:hypothetical protein
MKFKINICSAITTAITFFLNSKSKIIMEQHLPEKNDSPKVLPLTGRAARRPPSPKAPLKAIQEMNSLQVMVLIEVWKYAHQDQGYDGVASNQHIPR